MCMLGGCTQVWATIYVKYDKVYQTHLRSFFQVSLFLFCRVEVESRAQAPDGVTDVKREEHVKINTLYAKVTGSGHTP